MADPSKRMQPLTERIEEMIRRRGLLEPGDRILVGVSGGADSMALLHLLGELAEAWHWRLGVAHFNHRLRGQASRGDQRFVERVARRCRIPCFAEGGDVRKHARERKISTEMAGRELRHRFLRETAKREGYAKVALAHHGGDQVELLLLRLLRGSGGEGLSGMPWVSPSPMGEETILVRPLLGVTKPDLKSYLDSKGESYREDSSNAEKEAVRNFIRSEVMPILKEVQPALEVTWSRAMEIVGLEHDYVREQALKWLGEGAGGGAAFAALHPAVQREVIVVQLLKFGISAEFEWVEKLRSRVARPLTVASGKEIVLRENGVLEERQQIDVEAFSSRQQMAFLEGGEGEIGFEGLKFAWKRMNIKGNKLPKGKPGVEYFDARKVGRRIILRHWRKGDRFQPAGMKQNVKLQDLLVNNKVPVPDRHRLIVGEAENGEIFWVEGLRISEGFKLDKGTVERLKWSWYSQLWTKTGEKKSG